MNRQEQLFIEALAFSCYQFQLEIKKAVDNLIEENILSSHNNITVSKEDDL